MSAPQLLAVRQYVRDGAFYQGSEVAVEIDKDTM